MMFKKGVSWTSLASSPRDLAGNNTSGQRSRLVPTEVTHHLGARRFCRHGTKFSNLVQGNTTKFLVACACHLHSPVVASLPGEHLDDQFHLTKEGVRRVSGTGATCPGTDHGAVHVYCRNSVAKHLSDEARAKSDYSSVRSGNIIQPRPVREVQNGAKLTHGRCHLWWCRGTRKN